MIFNNNKGNVFANIFLVIITLIVFFALWPAVSAILSVAISVNEGNNATLDFLMNSIGFVIIIGLIVWIFNTVSNPNQSN